MTATSNKVTTIHQVIKYLEGQGEPASSNKLCLETFRDANPEFPRFLVIKDHDELNTGEIRSLIKEYLGENWSERIRLGGYAEIGKVILLREDDDAVDLFLLGYITSFNEC
jgi:hypothetical protein